MFFSYFDQKRKKREKKKRKKKLYYVTCSDFEKGSPHPSPFLPPPPLQLTNVKKNPRKINWNHFWQVKPYYDYEDCIDSDEELDMASMIEIE